MSLGITEEIIARQPPEAQAIIRLLLAKIAELESRIERLERGQPQAKPRGLRAPPSQAVTRAASRFVRKSLSVGMKESLLLTFVQCPPVYGVPHVCHSPMLFTTSVEGGRLPTVKSVQGFGFVRNGKIFFPGLQDA
jgi:hypothetical protein